MNPEQTSRNIFWRTIQLIFSQGFIFLIFYYSGNNLSASEFGLFNYSLSIVYFLILFSDFGISLSSGKFASEYGLTFSGKSTQILYSSLLFIFFVSLLIALLFYLVLPYIQYSENLATGLLIPLLFLIPAQLLFENMFRANRRFIQSSFVAIISFFVVVMVWYYLLSEGLNNFIKLIFLYYAVSFIFNLIFWNDFNIKISGVLLKKVFQYALFWGITGVMLYFSNRVDTLILAWFNELEYIGYYEIYFKLISIIFIPIIIIAQVLSPEISEMEAKNNYEKIFLHFKKFSTLSFVLSAVILLFFTFTVSLFLQYFFPTYYNTDFLHILYILIPSVFFNLAINGLLPLGFILPLKKARFFMIFLFIQGTFHFISSLLLVFWFEGKGVFISAFITNLAFPLWVYFYIRNYLLTKRI